MLKNQKHTIKKGGERILFQQGKGLIRDLNPSGQCLVPNDRSYIK